MVPYILLIALSGVLCFITIEKRNGAYSLLLGNSRRIVNKNIALPTFFVMLFLLVALRDVSVGNDTQNYQYIFEKYSAMRLREVIEDDGDVLYDTLMWLIGCFTDNYQICLTIVAALTIYPLAKLYLEDRQFGFLKIVLFVTLPIFILLFSGMRQWLSMSVGILAYEHIRERKPIRFLLTVLIAIGFHHSAFMLLPMYWIYHARLTTKSLYVVIPCIVLVYIFNKPIFQFLTSLMSTYSEKYMGDLEETGAYTSLLLYVMLAVFCFAIPDRNALDAETMGLRNFLLFAVMLQCFAPIHMLAMRLNYFFILFIPITIPKCMKATATKNIFLSKLAHVVMCVFFPIYFLFTCYQAMQDGGALQTVPYIPYWGG